MKSEVRKRINVVTTRLVKESSILYSSRIVSTPETAADLLKDFLEDRDRECFVVVCLDIKNHPTCISTISIGTLNASLVHPREVFKIAITTNAASVILSHNHPSGNPDPSTEDIEITRRLCEAGKILGINVLDHVIVGHERWVSLKERDLL